MSKGKALKGIAPGAIGAGIFASFGFGWLFSLPVSFWVLHDKEFELLPLSDFFRQFSAFELALIEVAEFLGVIAGAFTAASLSRGFERKAGLLVGVAMAAIRMAPVAIALLSVGRTSLLRLLLPILCLLAGIFGGRLSEWRHATTERQCDALDPWKQQSDSHEDERTAEPTHSSGPGQLRALPSADRAAEFETLSRPARRIQS